MSDESKRIRALLEPRGYEFIGGHSWKLKTGPATHTSRTTEDVERSALGHSLRDKAQVAVRQAEAAIKERAQVVVGPMQRNGVHGWGVWFNDHPVRDPIGFGPDIHEATNDFWLQVVGLEDPRRVTA